MGFSINGGVVGYKDEISSLKTLKEEEVMGE
jgi:hypothetical protein